MAMPKMRIVNDTETRVKSVDPDAIRDLRMAVTVFQLLQEAQETSIAMFHDPDPTVKQRSPMPRSKAKLIDLTNKAMEYAIDAVQDAMSSGMMVDPRAISELMDRLSIR